MVDVAVRYCGTPLKNFFKTGVYVQRQSIVLNAAITITSIAKIIVIGRHEKNKQTISAIIIISNIEKPGFDREITLD
jgi:hypothetical protein